MWNGSRNFMDTTAGSDSAGRLTKCLVESGVLSDGWTSAVDLVISCSKLGGEGGSVLGWIALLAL